MSQPLELTLDAVEEYIVCRGGKVTNHDLVKHFRSFLTDPLKKEEARSKFKEYVNALATIKQENGEKYVILKKAGREQQQELVLKKDSNQNSFMNVTGIGHSEGVYYNGEYNSPTKLHSPAGQSQIQVGQRDIYHGRDVPYYGSGSGMGNGYRNSHSSSSSLLDEVMQTYNSSYGQYKESYDAILVPENRHYVPNHYGRNEINANYNSYGLAESSATLESISKQKLQQPTFSLQPDVPARAHAYNYPSQPVGLPSSHHVSGLPGYSVQNVVGLPSCRKQGSRQPTSLGSIPSDVGLPVAPPPYRPPPERPTSSHSSRPLPPPPPQLQVSVSSRDQLNFGGQRSTSVASNYSTTSSEALNKSYGGDRRSSIVSNSYSHDSFSSNTEIPPPLQRRFTNEDASPPPLLPRRPSEKSMYRDQSSNLQPVSSDAALSLKSNVDENLNRKLNEPEKTRSFIRSVSEDNCVERRETDYLVKSNSSDKILQSLSEKEKENISDSLENIPDSERMKEKISVRERTITFNRLASQVDLASANIKSKSAANVKRRNSRAQGFHDIRRGSVDVSDRSDSMSISTVDPAAKQCMILSAKQDYQGLARLLKDEPKLARTRDFTNGYTALHWAAKHGNLDMVKLLAGTYTCDVNARSHGGYTPLHLAYQFSHHDTSDVLVKAYGADGNVRDFSGKKPRQYMVVGDTGVGLSLSNDTFRELKNRRKNNALQKNPGILRFGSMSVKVKKTTEALNKAFGKANNNDKDDFIPHLEKSLMPPPKFASVKKRKSKKAIDFQQIVRSKSAPQTPVNISPKTSPKAQRKSGEHSVGHSSADSDSEYGFGDGWT